MKKTTILIPVLLLLLFWGCEKNPTESEEELIHKIKYQLFVMPVGASNIPNGLSDSNVRYTTSDGIKSETITIGEGEGYTWNTYFGWSDFNSGSYVELEFNTDNDRIRGSIHLDGSMWIEDYVQYFEGNKRIYGTIP